MKLTGYLIYIFGAFFFSWNAEKYKMPFWVMMVSVALLLVGFSLMSTNP